MKLTRYERYQALKAASLRCSLATLADNPTDRTVTRAAGLARAWDRIGCIVYPDEDDYPDPQPRVTSRIDAP